MLHHITEKVIIPCLFNFLIYLTFHLSAYPSASTNIIKATLGLESRGNYIGLVLLSHLKQQLFSGHQLFYPASFLCSYIHSVAILMNLAKW